MLSTRFGSLSDTLRRQLTSLGADLSCRLGEGTDWWDFFGEVALSCVRGNEGPALRAGAGPIANASVQAGEPELSSVTTTGHTIGTGFPFWGPGECNSVRFVLTSSAKGAPVLREFGVPDV